MRIRTDRRSYEKMRKNIQEEMEIIMKPDLDDALPATPEEIYSAYIGFVRAYHLWMHGAHNVTKGTGFGGDHELIYGKIYVETQEAIDMVIEKGMGIYQDEGIACPMRILENAAMILNDWESPSGHDAERIADLALEYTKQLVSVGTGTSEILKEMGALSYGTDNMLAGLVDTHENYAYLLQQRTK